MPEVVPGGSASKYTNSPGKKILCALHITLQCTAQSTQLSEAFLLFSMLCESNNHQHLKKFKINYEIPC